MEGKSRQSMQTLETSKIDNITALHWLKSRES